MMEAESGTFATSTVVILSSLVQVIMDPQFRTMDGVFSLFKKEWLAGR